MDAAWHDREVHRPRPDHATPTRSGWSTEVQAEYVVRYGGAGRDPARPGRCSSRRGARSSWATATACPWPPAPGGAATTSRRSAPAAPPRSSGCTSPRPARGLGLARRMLAHLEDDRRRRRGRGDDPRDRHRAARGDGALRDLRATRASRASATTARPPQNRCYGTADLRVTPRAQLCLTGGLGVAAGSRHRPGGGAVEQRDPQARSPSARGSVGQVRDAGLDADQRGQLGRQLGRLDRAAACRPGRWKVSTPGDR